MAENISLRASVRDLTLKAQGMDSEYWRCARIQHAYTHARTWALLAAPHVCSCVCVRVCVRVCVCVCVCVCVSLPCVHHLLVLR